MKNNGIDATNIISFPPPGALGYKNICLITKDIPLQLLYSAYMQGIFPWFNEDKGEPVLWYSPSPRFCLKMEELHIPHSVERFLKKTPFTYTMDKAFTKVMEGCRSIERTGQSGTWIGPLMMAAYTDFHKAGYAHSVEVWLGDELVGGFYGILIGSVFCGESMFTRKSNSSKSAFALFAKAFASIGGALIDSQVYTDNIARYGAKNISREAFLRLEADYLFRPLLGNLQEAFQSFAPHL